MVLLVGACVYLYLQYNILLEKAMGKGASATLPVARKPAARKSRPEDTQWKAVKVKTGLMCCQRAEKMRGEVFLIADAPGFPLKDCKVDGCECKYIHMDDRRDGDDRRESTEFLEDLFGLHRKNRRKNGDRRAMTLTHKS